MKHLKTLESYSNIKELKILTEDIIRLMSKDIAKMYTTQDDKHTIVNLFNKIDIQKYHIIEDFIKNNFVNKIVLFTKTGFDFKGGYLYGEMDLNIYPLHSNIIILTSKDGEKIQQLLSNELYYTILHELQHAYDDYRSHGKFIKISDIKHGKDLERYYNSTHELSSYFTDTVSSIEFSYITYEETPTSQEDGIVNVIKEMYDFDITKQNFIKKFIGWSYLTVDNKKKMLHKLGKYYVIVNDEVNKYNQEKNTKNFY
jgi:hypothetical protein